MYTHGELISIAEKWLLNTQNCGFVFKELRCYTPNKEIPDAIGFCNGYSILIECKTSYKDFKSDSKKLFRKRPELGMGSFRFYMAPEGIITPDELPYKWGLIEVNSKRRAVKKTGPKGNIWSRQGWKFKRKSNNSEMAMLISALRRVHLRGDLEKIYTL